MFRFKFITDRRTKVSTKRVLFLGLSWLLASASCMAPYAAQGKNRAAAVQPAAAGKPDPDTLLLNIYREIGAYDLQKALADADKLVAAYPTFHLGHLIRGDLLLMQTQSVTTFGDVKNGPADKLTDLREEAMARLRSLRHRPDPNLLPRTILQLRDDQKHALVIDAGHSRLYLYENHGGQPKYVADYYISQGKLGVNKLKAGDQKTPIGVYYITGHLSGARLPEIYGSGALPINYPNEWDKLKGRSGYGIWLHGTPPDSYSRPPLSSDGCIVLTNPDLYKVTNAIEIGKTPVVISEHAEFVDKAKWTKDRNLAAKLLDHWLRDVESRNPLRVMANYSRHFKSLRGEDLTTWFNRHEQIMNGSRPLSVKVYDVTYFRYPGRDNMIVSTFTLEAHSGRSRSSVRKRQYWAKEGAQWKVVYEMNL